MRRTLLCAVMLLLNAVPCRAELPVDPQLIRSWGGDDFFVGDRLKSLSISSDGNWLAWCAEQGVSALIDLRTNRLDRYLSASTKRSQVLFLAEPDEALVTLRQDTPARAEIWNLRENKRLREFPDLPSHFALSADRRSIVSQHGNELWLRDIQSGAMVAKIPKFPYAQNEIRMFALMPNGRRVLIVHHYWNISVWDFDSQQQVWQQEDKRASVANAAFSNDGQTLAVALNGGRVDVRDSATGLLRFEMPSKFAEGLSFTPDDKRLWFIGQRDLKLVDLKTKQAMQEVELLKSAPPNFDVFVALKSAVTPDGKRVLMADDRRIWSWNLETLKPDVPLKTTRGWGTVAAFSRRGDRLLCAEGNDGWIERDLVSGEIRQTHPTAPRVARIHVPPTDDMVVVQARSPIQTEGRLEWWNGAAEVPMATRQIRSMSEWHFSTDGQTLYGVNQGIPTLFDARTAQPLMAKYQRLTTNLKITADDHWITAYAVNSELRILVDDRFACVPFEPGGLRAPLIFPNSSTIGAIGGSGVILWDIKTCEELRRIPCSVSDVAGWPTHTWSISRDGSRLAVVTADYDIQMWNAKTGAEITTLRGHRGPISSLDFSPDQQQLVSGSLDGSLRLWQLPK